ncbi:unnamed protein product [Callosobruchus maculatus]|uniref:Reverse transcriptase domain-containing protein n=1 Tax=Callosobruchus maculatus TaxID=64391 RepID=A0A653DSG5_CALMS|nr:unnamed protein product [Callosobruchus maculatus]
MSSSTDTADESMDVATRQDLSLPRKRLSSTDTADEPMDVASKRSKAFDNVKWPKLWEILISMGVPYHLVFLIQQLYESNSARVRIDGNLSSQTATRKGVRQGCVLSPMLFNIYSEFVMRQVLDNWNGGVTIGGSKISNLRFADDTTLIAASQEELVALLNILEQHSAAYGLGINYNKTKVMIVDREHDNYREIKSIGRCEALVAMTKLTKIWRDHNITKATKMSLVQSLVFSIFLYASETWTVKKADRARIDAFEMWTWRRMLRVPYTTHRTNVSILDEVGNPKRLSSIVSTRMLTFFGHIHRSDNMEKLRVDPTFACNILDKWCGESGLSINPSKTKLVLFTHRKKGRFISPSIHQYADSCFTLISDDQCTIGRLTEIKSIRFFMSDRHVKHVRAGDRKVLPVRHLVPEEHINEKQSYTWLQDGQLFPETEGFMLPIQDQVIATINYKKYIIKDPSVTNDNCRKCHQQKETIDHIASACKTLAGTEYTARHNSAAKIIHQALVTTNKLIENTDPYYNYIPTSVLDSNQYKLYWDVEIHTDKTIPANRPVIVFQSKADKVTYLIDIAIPNDTNIQTTYAGKISKYTDLAIEVKRLWKQNKVVIVPLIMSVSGLTPNTFTPHLHQLGLDEKLHKIFQKSVILKTCSIVRSFLNSDQKCGETEETARNVILLCPALSESRNLSLNVGQEGRQESIFQCISRFAKNLGWDSV